jgi:hypothetical protein
MFNNHTRRCLAVTALLVTALAAPTSSSGQTPPAADASKMEAAPGSPSGDWAVSFTPYGWLSFLSGSQTVKGRTATIDTNVFQMFDKSQSLIPFMGYVEARFQDRIGFFVDLMYMNLTAGDAKTRDFTVNPFVTGSIAANASVNLETLTVQFGGAYELAKIGPDRSVEGPGMAGVGRTAFDILAGGRYWYQKADITVNVTGTLTANIDNLELSADRSKLIARSGAVTWVDPYVGLRIRHKLASRQDLLLEGDIGGFGLGSRISWQALATYKYEFATTGSVAWAGVLGYRFLYVDYTQGWGNSFFELNLLQHGPVIGLSARF